MRGREDVALEVLNFGFVSEDTKQIIYNDFFERNRSDVRVIEELQINRVCRSGKSNCVLKTPEINIYCSLYDLYRLCKRNNNSSVFLGLGCVQYLYQPFRAILFFNCLSEPEVSICERRKWLSRAAGIANVLLLGTILDKHATNIIVTYVLMLESSLIGCSKSNISSNRTHCKVYENVHDVLCTGYEWLWWQHRKTVGKQPFPCEFWEVYFRLQVGDSTRLLFKIPLQSILGNICFDFVVKVESEYQFLFSDSEIVFYQQPRATQEFYNIKNESLCYSKWHWIEEVQHEKCFSSFFWQRKPNWLCLSHSFENGKCAAAPVHIVYLPCLLYGGLGFLFNFQIVSRENNRVSLTDAAVLFESVSLCVKTYSGDYKRYNSSKLVDLRLDEVADMPRQCPSLYYNDKSNFCSNNDTLELLPVWYFLPVSTELNLKEALNLQKLSYNTKTVNLTEVEYTMLVFEKSKEQSTQEWESETNEIQMETYWKYFDILTTRQGAVTNLH